MRATVLAWGWVAALLAVPAGAQTPLVLPARTPIFLETVAAVPATLATGSPVTLAVASAVTVDGVVLIPKGAAVRAFVADARTLAQNGKGGYLRIKVGEILLDHGIEVPLVFLPPVAPQAAAVAVAGESQTIPVIANTGLVLTAAAAGKDVAIPAGTSLTGFTAADLTWNPEKFANPGNPAPKLAPSAALSADVLLVLKEAGVTDAELLARIRRAPPRDWREADFERLRRAGISPLLLNAIEQAQGRQ